LTDTKQKSPTWSTTVALSKKTFLFSVLPTNHR
jgi:hypothetical protein